MTHIEAFETRQLMAATGLDSTFGTAGAVTLPKGVVAGDTVVSFPDGYVVSARYKKQDYLYKITQSGQIDTAFGDNGRIVTPAFGVDTLMYDKKYNLLYAAGVTNRYTGTDGIYNGNVATLRIERFSGLTGAVDAGFGDAGIASFEYGKTNTTVVNKIAIGKLVPLAGRGLAVAFNHDSYAATGDAFASAPHANEVTVLKYNPDGSRVSKFGRRGIVVAATGTHDYHYAAVPGITETQSFNEPTFSDLQYRTDGTLRVLTLRNAGSSTYSNDDEGLRTVKSVVSVESQVLTTSGKVDSSQGHTWQIAKNSPSDVIGIVSGEYESLLVQASGDDGAVAIGTRVTSQIPGSYYRQTTEAITLSATAKPVYTTINLGTQYNVSFLSYGNGYFAVNGNWSRKLRTDFHYTPTYNGGKPLIVDLPSTTNYGLAVDIDGRLIALSGNQIFRITG